MQLALSLSLAGFWITLPLWIWSVRWDLRYRPSSFAQRTRALTWLVMAFYLAAAATFIGREVWL